MMRGSSFGAKRMRLHVILFEVVECTSVPVTKHKGDTGVSHWRTRQFGDIRVRIVEYSAGYLANHWCEKGHIVLCLEGELHTELQDGRTVVLKPGMSYHVSDGTQAHRSSTTKGAKLFIVD